MLVLFPLSRLTAARKRAASRVRLEELNDHLLRDIGFTRDPISSSVRKETQFVYGPFIR